MRLQQTGLAPITNVKSILRIDSVIDGISNIAGVRLRSPRLHIKGRVVQFKLISLHFILCTSIINRSRCFLVILSNGLNYLRW